MPASSADHARAQRAGRRCLCRASRSSCSASMRSKSPYAGLAWGKMSQSPCRRPPCRRPPAAAIRSSLGPAPGLVSFKSAPAFRGEATFRGEGTSSVRTAGGATEAGRSSRLRTPTLFCSSRTLGLSTNLVPLFFGVALSFRGNCRSTSARHSKVLPVRAILVRNIHHDCAWPY